MVNRTAFTMIELIIVMIILGIVSMISAEIIASIYERYIVTRAYNQLETKTELALDQIAKRLQYRIKESSIARKADETNFVPLSSADTTYPVLEWIGYDNDSLNGDYNTTSNSPMVGWSGFVDLKRVDSNASQIVSSGSHFNVANTIINAISNGQIHLSSANCNNAPAILFKGTTGSFDICRFGWNGNFNGVACAGSIEYSLCVNKPTANDNTLQFVGPHTPAVLYEQYHMSWSAYALVPEEQNGSICNTGLSIPQNCTLRLYYDYQPWNGRESYRQNGRSAIVLDHITAFRFKQTGNAIHIKLCAMDAGFNQYMESNVSICKERVVF